MTGKIYNQQEDPADKYRKNREIKAQILLVIDENGEQLGELSLQDALTVAQERNLDLIEVAPKAEPPVGKIMSLAKFKYEQKKKKKDNKKRAAELKEMWFKAFIAEGDLKHKLKKVEEFIKKKNPVKITIRAKGRVKKEHLTELMDRILLSVEEYAEPDSRPRFQGKNYAVIVKPRKTKIVKLEDQPEAETAKVDPPQTEEKPSEVIK